MAEKVRVAVILEQRLVRQGLRALLEDETDIEVVGDFGSADSPLEAMARTRPNVALVGVELAARDDGLQLGQAIRNQDPDVGVLFLARSAAPELVTRAFRAGAIGFLVTRTASARVLTDSVHAVARGEPILQSSLVDPVILSLRNGADGEGAGVGLGALSPREREVLALVAEGADNLKIAAILGVSERTVKAHVTAILRKLNVENRTHAALLAWEAGLRR